MDDEDLNWERLATVAQWLRDHENDWPEPKAEWFETSLKAFEDMLGRGRPLTDNQMAWVEKVADAAEIDLPAPKRKPVPPGKPVALIIDGMKKPARPPGM